MIILKNGKIRTGIILACLFLFSLLSIAVYSTITLVDMGQETAYINSSLRYNTTSENITAYVFNVTKTIYYTGEITTLCYQETANISTACGGLDSGNYSFNADLSSPENSYDGNWSSFSEGTAGNKDYYFVNYTIPVNVSSFIITGKLNYADEVSCILYIKNPNTNNWDELTAISCNDSKNNYTVSSGSPYLNSSLVQLKFRGGSFGGVSSGIYEESIWWNISSIANFTSNYTLTNASFVYDWRKNGESDMVVNLPFGINGSMENTSNIKNYALNGINASLIFNNTLVPSSPTWNRNCNLFNGSSGCMSFPFLRNEYISFNSYLNLSYDYTMCVWFSTTLKPAGNGGIILGGDIVAGSAIFQSFRVSSTSKLQATYAENNSNTLVQNCYSNTTIVANIPYFACISYANSNLTSSHPSLYLNGKDDTNYANCESPVTNLSGLNKLYHIGKTTTLTTLFNGSIDQIQVWNRVLSPAEIAMMYESNVSNSYNRLHSDATSKGDTWYAVVTASDGYEESSPYSSNNITISYNTIPSISQPNLSPIPVFAVNDTNCSAYIYDADSDLLTAYFNFTVNGSYVAEASYINQQNGTQVSYLLNHSNYSFNDNITCYVTVFDGNITLPKLSASTLVSIPNVSPILGVVSISPSTAYTTDDLNCSFTITDSNTGDSLSANVSWYNGTAFYKSYNISVSNGSLSSNILKAANTTKGETWNCSVTAYDGTEYSASNSTTRYINNSIPTIPVIVYPANNSYESGYLETQDSTDADNDNINYTLWISNNSDFSSAAYYNSTLNLDSPEYIGGGLQIGVDSILSSGQYWSRILAFDGEINSSWSSILNVTFDFDVPETYPLLPLNGSYISNSSILFSWLAIDMLPIYCSLYFDSSLYDVSDILTANDTTTYYQIDAIAEGFDGVDIDCYDFVGNNNAIIDTLYFTIDTINPSIALNTSTEVNNSYVSRTYLYMNITSSDTNLANITVRLYNSSHSMINSSLTTISPNFLNVSSLSDGIYYFNATSRDLANNRNDTVTRKVTIDNTKPRIFLTLPNNSASMTEGYVNFTYYVNDTNSVNCTLNFYGSNFTITPVINTYQQSFYQNKNAGTYDWRIYCTDAANNMNVSETRSITLTAISVPLPPSEGGGGSQGALPTTERENITLTEIWSDIPQKWDMNERNITIIVYSNKGAIIPDTLSLSFSREDFIIKSTEKGFNSTIALKPSSLAEGNYSMIITAFYGTERISRKYNFEIKDAYMEKLVEKIANKITGDTTRDISESTYKSYIWVGILVLLAVCIGSFGLYKHFKHRGKHI